MIYELATIEELQAVYDLVQQTNYQMIWICHWWKKNPYEYYKNTLETGEHIGYLVYDNETFIGAGGVSFYQVMPTYHNPTGKRLIL